MEATPGSLRDSTTWNKPSKGIFGNLGGKSFLESMAYSEDAERMSGATKTKRVR